MIKFKKKSPVTQDAIAAKVRRLFDEIQQHKRWKRDNQ